MRVKEYSSLILLVFHLPIMFIIGCTDNSPSINRAPDLYEPWHQKTSSVKQPLLLIKTIIPSLTPTYTPTATPAPISIELMSNSVVLAGPGSVYPVLKTLLSGVEIKIIGQSINKKWIVIELIDGEQGWINKDDLEDADELSDLPKINRPPTPTPYVVVINNDLGRNLVIYGPHGSDISFGAESYGRDTTAMLTPGIYSSYRICSLKSETHFQEYCGESFSIEVIDSDLSITLSQLRAQYGSSIIPKK